MPRRLSLKISDRVNNRLERLMVETEAESLTEVIRNALATYDALRQAKRNGDRILIMTDGKLRDLELI